MKTQFLSTTLSTVQSLILSLLLISASHAANSLHIIKPLNIIDPWVPETPPGARVMAGFMQIHNPGNKNLEITAVSSPDFNSVEMHLSKDVNGIAKMLQQKTLNIPAKGKLVLKAGSYHLMLMQPKNRLIEGDKTTLIFTLSNGETMSFNAPVKKNKMKKHKIMKCGAGKCGGGN